VSFLLILIGFVLIIKGADYFIEGSKSIASFLKMSPIVAGVIIVAFGTSLPELFVSINAALKGVGNITVGNIIGSNIANIGLGLGSTAIITPLLIKKDEAFKKHMALLFASLLFVLFLWDLVLTRAEGVILLLIFVVFIHLILSGEKQESIGKYSFWKTTIYFFGGIAALMYGSEILINNAVLVARSIGVSERVIGLSLIAFGTSLPEMVTSVVSALKKDYAISVGTIIGSNIFNLLFVMGVAITIRPINVELQLLKFDLPVMILFVFFLFPFIFKEKIGRFAGIFLLISYAGYMLSLFS